MRMPLAGGPAVKIADKVVGFKMSPTGRRIVYVSLVTAADRAVARGTVIDADGKVLYERPASTNGTGTFTPTEDALALVNTSAGVSNVFIQPLSDAPARQLTHFTKGQIASVEFLPGGELLLRRIENKMDTVLIRNFR